ncbi:MAG: hypothetical protein J0G32_07990 [Alphaproteobacteria bacterium]|nr:hypothetical protein [Alphaproteobacteria bacterium]OJV15838.1 MAG: hypothetical protein BGO27_07995 [Alphaproteobacteria bacterium 33-17]
MNNRHIITISLYIILNSFFILIISQSKFTPHNEKPVYDASTNEHTMQKKVESSMVGTLEESSRLAMWVFKRNYQGEYEISIDINDLFENDTLKPQHLNFFKTVFAVINDNKKLMKLKIELPEYPKFSSRDNISYLFDLFSTQLDRKDLLTLIIVPNSKLTMRIKSND